MLGQRRDCGFSVRGPFSGAPAWRCALVGGAQPVSAWYSSAVSANRSLAEVGSASGAVELERAVRRWRVADRAHDRKWCKPPGSSSHTSASAGSGSPKNSAGFWLCR
ncbi:MAG: hypothetical protein U0Z44_08900 [Kouleothrix sp.]